MFAKDQKYAFISYSHANKEVVEEKLKELQEKYDLNIWWDKNLIPGMHWFNEQVVPVLNDDNCCCVIYFGSKEALQSEPCEHELELANRNEIRIIPVNFTDKKFEEIAIELKSQTAINIAEKYLPKDHIFVSITSGDFDGEIKKAYDHYSGENKKKNSAKWIDIEFAADIKYYRECEDENYDEEDYYFDEDDDAYDKTPLLAPEYVTKILAMFYCEMCKFKFKAKFDYHIADKNTAKICYFGENSKKEYTEEELLKTISVYNADGINYYEHSCPTPIVNNVEAIGYLAKIVNLIADNNTKMNFRSMDIVDIAEQYINKYDLQEFTGIINDYNPGQPEVVTYSPCIDFDDFTYDSDDFEGSTYLHFDQFYAILKTFWKRFVDPEAE